jgi:cytochrome c553
MPCRPSRPSAAAVLLALVTVASVPALSAAQADGAAGARSEVASAFDAKVRPLLQTYCYACHGTQKQKGDLDLSRYADATQAMRTRKLWKEVAAKVHEKDMPPEEQAKQPSAAERDLISGWFSALKGLDRPDPGRTTLHRLNRIEYGYTIRDLLGVDVQAGEDFPKDDVSDGFDNIADTLSLSPFLLEKYLLSADLILDRALFGDAQPLHAGAGELDWSSDGRSDPGVPQARERLLTATGELTRTLSLARAGSYTVAVRAGADQQGELAVRLVVLVDGHALCDGAISAPTTQPGVISCSGTLGAGEHRLVIEVHLPQSAAAVPAAGAAAQRIANPAHRRCVVVESVEVRAPDAELTSAPARSLLVALPGPGLGKREAARIVAARFASRAYRRPASDDQVDLLLTIFDLADRQGRSFPRAVKEMLKAALVAPEFLFRIEQERPGDQDGNYLIDDYDLASRMSYFLWSSAPDDELLDLAGKGTLHEPAVSRAQLTRMIKDARIQRFIDNFAGQWLLLRNVLGEPQEAARKDKGRGGLSPELRTAMFAEGTGLFGYILREGRSLGEFIDPGYTFLNEALAKHYGIDGVSGDEMRLVQLADHRRGGVLTLGALLAVNSHPDRTSPTRRGRWVLEEVIGKPPPPPPPNVPQLQFVRAKNPKASEREVLEIHRASPACASCHRVMDPIGFGLENFDNQGRWRDKLKDAPIDVSGELPGKRTFNGPAELKGIISGHTGDLAHVLGERVMTYALGRALQYYDDDTIDHVVATTEHAGYRLDTLIIETALSFPFRHRHRDQ